MDSSLITKSISSHNAQSSTTRYFWLDWMRAIGMVLIIYGHFFSIGEKYIYVFSVPLFFLISGFLSKTESDNKIFWTKLWYNLVTPLILICSLNYFIGIARWYFLSSCELENPIHFVGRMILGLHSAVGNFWFVYTLIVLKVIFQYTRGIWTHLILFVICLALAYIINNFDILIFGRPLLKMGWSVANTLVAYPFFIAGHYLSLWKEDIANYRPSIFSGLWISILLCIVFICGQYNSDVRLYICGYGDSIILYLIGGLAGTTLIYFISNLLENIQWKWITDISVGTTIILGFHYYFIVACRRFFPTASAIDIVFTLGITIIFILTLK